MRKSEILDPGTYFYVFEHNKPGLITTINLNIFPKDKQDAALVLSFHWVVVDELGYLEGTSIEDVRFIPESKYFKPVPLTAEHGFHYTINQNIKDSSVFLIPSTTYEHWKSKYVHGNWIIPKTLDELKIEYPPKDQDHFLDALKYQMDQVTCANEICFDSTGTITKRRGYITTQNGGIVAICSCGGKIDSHKPECPENQEEMNEIMPFYILDESPQRYLGMPVQKKCECGSDSLGSPKHSHWCAKYEKVD